MFNYDFSMGAHGAFRREHPGGGGGGGEEGEGAHVSQGVVGLRQN